jgi:TRAP-type C4-dicarboxylate transport system permease small subunit
MVALVVMMLVTIVDVTMRMLLNELVLGSVELVELALVAVVFLALPETFVRDEHITVDLVDQVVRAKTLRRIRTAAAIVTAVFLGAMAWRTVPPALDTLEIGDLTSDLQLSLFWYWLPIVIGAVVAAVIVVALAWRRLAAAGATEP